MIEIQFSEYKNSSYSERIGSYENNDRRMKWYELSDSAQVINCGGHTHVSLAIGLLLIWAQITYFLRHFKFFYGVNVIII